ncbi:8-amino-7-oxononanoate synthase [hydrothermal vent metagenome]|uniref:8-amino-7-oxononanoate synthase n=1 Tax=hydrothermal vent metagenome TaxID=652676 RepID=A0A1W1ELC7_9ZZZZ
MYKISLKALKKAQRFRSRKIDNPNLIDFASNDYLGLANKTKLLDKAIKLVKRYDNHSPRSSMLVNGYHPIHKLFEERLLEYQEFENATVVGSGFLANISLIEALTRRGDILFIDEEYHASGVLATKLIEDRVVYFAHNDPQDLENKLKRYRYNRSLIAVEGVYSMSGNICNREIIDIANSYNSILIMDEAHSSGVIGKNLLGIFDYYNLPIKENYIKMGTLGKAYGSYGAYILASNEIISFLENRAKPIIYSTAPSIIDIALALINLEYIHKNRKKLLKKIEVRYKIIKEILNIEKESLILAISQKSNQDALYIQKLLIDNGYMIGAIRPPTVKSPILRVIPRLGSSKKDLINILKIIKYNRV